MDILCINFSFSMCTCLSVYGVWVWVQHMHCRCVNPCEHTETTGRKVFSFIFKHCVPLGQHLSLNLKVSGLARLAGSACLCSHNTGVPGTHSHARLLCRCCEFELGP